MRPDGRQRVRTVVTVACVAAVVVGEFFLLTTVFDRVGPVRADRLAASRLAGEVAAATSSGVTPAVVNDIDETASRLPLSGAPQSVAAPVLAAAQSLTSDPGSAAALQRLRAVTGRLQRAAYDQQRSLDTRTTVLYAVLLALVSWGWFGWFRRVIRRQRALQEALTEGQAVLRAEQRLAAVVHAASDAVLVVDRSGVVSYATPSCASVLRSEPERLVGDQLTALLPDSDAMALLDLLTAVDPGDEQSIEVGLVVTGADDRRLDVNVRNLEQDDAVRGTVVTVRDVTERRRFETELSRMALEDSLTGLPNRRLFTDRLSHALSRRADGRRSHAVLFCDLDEFKSVNDSLGHSMGDAVLTAVGQRLLSLLRPGDTAARLGDDEFAVLLEGVSAAEAVDVANRLVAELSAPYDIAGVSLQVGVSMGVAEAVVEAINAADALRNADLALYRAKADGRGRVAVYEPALHAEALEQLRMRSELRDAICLDQFRVFWQPQIGLADGAVVGFEALVRWQHPERGLLYPGVFLPAVHSAGLDIDLDRWVLRESCRAGTELAAERPVHLSVNLSAAMLGTPQLVSEVRAALDPVDLAPEQLTIEITETSLIDDLDALTPKLRALRDLGVQVAIDDFGTGFSSLAYVHQLPVDVLKIDRSFVSRVTDGPHEATVTEAIVDLGRRLSFTTVAEGVETLAQRDWLRAARCHSAQGFLWSPAVEQDTARRMAARGTISERAGESGNSPQSGRDLHPAVTADVPAPR